jgi:hypothetical protein
MSRCRRGTSGQEPPERNPAARVEGVAVDPQHHVAGAGAIRAASPHLNLTSAALLTGRRRESRDRIDGTRARVRSSSSKRGGAPGTRLSQWRVLLVRRLAVRAGASEPRAGQAGRVGGRRDSDRDSDRAPAVGRGVAPEITW